MKMLKVIEQDSNISGSNIHPVSINEERIAGAFQQFIGQSGGLKLLHYFLEIK